MDEITPIAIPASLAFWALRIYSTFLLSRKSAVVSVDVVGNAVSGWIHCTCEWLDITLLYNTPLPFDYADKKSSCDSTGV